MNTYLKITVSTVALLGISAAVYFGGQAYSKSKEVKPVKTLEAVNVYMTNPVSVNYKDLTVKVPDMPTDYIKWRYFYLGLKNEYSA